MDSDSFDGGRRRRATLTKQPPPSALSTRPSLRKPQSSTSLQRAPSAPYPRSQAASQSARDIHKRTTSNAYGSSTSSLEQVSALNRTSSPLCCFAIHTSLTAYPPQTQFTPSSRTSDDRTQDLIGAPFDATTILSSIQSSSAHTGPSAQSGRAGPPPLHHTHTSPDLRFPHTQISAPIPPGGQTMEVTPPRSENGVLSPKRLSGDTYGARPFGATRKKSGFSSFVNSMLGSPRAIKISNPENPVHMIHVGYDSVTGQFTVRWTQAGNLWHLLTEARVSRKNGSACYRTSVFPRTSRNRTPR
jgi:p21-activated kinase 1